MGIVLRVIPSQIPTIDDLKLPGVLRKISDASRGLILVTGATGSGKSSTLAAMIDYLNANQALHILTIEDPVEYLHPQKKCRMSQRELGRDTASYGKALKSALRQDPDVILIGEMRDYETLDIALKASETGHLVFSTVHTSDAMKTIGRLIALYPAEEQMAARLRISDNLHAIISQRLIPDKEGKRVVAQEILINNFGIAECIADPGKTGEIPDFIEKGKEVSGMQTFDQALVELAQNGTITTATALEYASNPADFQRNLSFGNTSTRITDTSAPEEKSGTLSLEQYESPGIEVEGAKPGAKAPPKSVPKPATPLPGLPKAPKPPKAA
jgi:twitching motility protein PilT